MFLRFPSLADTKKLELDLFYSGAAEWHTYIRPLTVARTRLKPPLIPAVGCSL